MDSWKDFGLLITTFAKEYLTDLHENVFGGLVDDGHFYDPLVKEVEDVFMPWVTDQVVAQLDKVALSRKLVDQTNQGNVRMRIAPAGRSMTASSLEYVVSSRPVLLETFAKVRA